LPYGLRRTVKFESWLNSWTVSWSAQVCWSWAAVPKDYYHQGKNLGSRTSRTRESLEWPGRSISCPGKIRFGWIALRPGSDDRTELTWWRTRRRGNGPRQLGSPLRRAAEIHWSRGSLSKVTGDPGKTIKRKPRSFHSGFEELRQFSPG